MTHPLFRRPRLLAAAATAIILAGSIGIGAPSPALAVDTHPTINASPATGTVDDMPGVMISTNLDCGSSPGLAYHFWLDTHQDVSAPFAVPSDSTTPAQLEVVADQLNTHPIPLPLQNPLGALVQLPWIGGDDLAPFTATNFSSPYTLVVACVNATDDTLVRDADGNAKMGWTALVVDGDGNFVFGDGTSTPVATATTTTLVAPVVNGDGTVALTATVAADGGATVADGTVQFFDGATKLGEQAVSNGSASFTTAVLSAGSHSITAGYVPSGDTLAASTSAAVTATIPGSQSQGTTLALAAAGSLGSDGKPQAALTATVSQDGATATDAAGTVQFLRDGTAVGDPQDVASGVAQLTDPGLSFDTDYSYTAAFTPASGSSLEAATSSAVKVNVASPVELTDGMQVTPGATYFVDQPDATFTNGETVAGEVHSDPVAVGSAAASGTGGLHFAFVMPSVGAGTHTLTLTGATSGTTITAATFTIAATGGGGGNDDPTTTPASFATDWFAHVAASSPALVWTVIGIVVLLCAALGGWTLFWRRRRGAATGAGE